MGTMVFDDKAVKNIHLDLWHIQKMGNEFSCYALRRLNYYKRQKELAFIGPKMVMQRLWRSQKDDADRHFERAHERCNTATRPT
jgi:hypothetical protein